MQRKHFVWIMAMLAVFTMQACGKSSSSDNGTTPQTAALSVMVTDAPGDFDHVYITVKKVLLHLKEEAEPSQNANEWVGAVLNPPVTLDLLNLGSGSNLQSLLDNVSLPAGAYKQIRLFLAPTYAVNPPAGHAYYNEIVTAGSTTAVPLRIPDADDGIQVLGSFTLTSGSTLRLAIDFDAGDDIIDFNNGQEYILKPRLTYFDLDNAGAIVGQIHTNGTPTIAPRFVIKAEKLNADGTYHMVHRSAAPDATGKFVLYPVSAATATATYDVLVRGIGYQTTIIKGVPVSRGTTPASNPTAIPLITMVTGTDYIASASIASPTGAWMNFYQTLPGAGEVPYEIRFNHFHPITGSFSGYRLSNSPLQVGTYNASAISTSTVTPAEGAGGYQAVADAILYDQGVFPGSSAPNVAASAPTVTFGSLSVSSPFTPHSASGTIDMSSLSPGMMGQMSKGYVFAVHGGMIVNAKDVGTTMMAGGGSYTMTNLPGGTTTTPHPRAFYGVEAVGWSPVHPFSVRAIAFPPGLADLRTGNASGITMKMIAY